MTEEAKPLLTPKFITIQMVMRAVDAAYDAVMKWPAVDLLKPKDTKVHVVVLVPGMKDDRPDYSDYPNYPIVPVLFYQKSFGSFAEDEAPPGIARCKVVQIWDGSNDDRTDCIPHLLFPGDTPYWGAVKRDGIAVACSGIQPWEDKAIAGIAVDLIRAMAYQAWWDSEDREKKSAFLA